MFERIVVLAEGTDATQPGLRRAVLCAAPKTEIVVLDAVYEPMLEGYMGDKTVYEPLRNRVLAERAERVAALARSVAQRGFAAVGKALWAARREEAIEESVRPRHPDLVVTAPLDGGRGGLASGDWRLLATSPAPVLIVKGPGGRQYRNIVAAVDPFHAHAKPADLDARILAVAAKLQAQTGATLTVVHCYAPPEYFRADPRLAPRADDIETRRREALVGLLRESGLPLTAAKVLPGAPHEVLQGLAERGEADVIVMGALARGRFKDWLIGSTAERVLHRTQVDVLAVNPTR